MKNLCLHRNSFIWNSSFCGGSNEPMLVKSGDIEI